MDVTAQPQTSRDNRSEFVREESMWPMLAGADCCASWHGKWKLLVRIKLMDIVRNFTLMLFSSFFWNTDRACCVITLKCFPSMNSRGREKENFSGQRKSYLPNEACTALNCYQPHPGCFHLPGMGEQSVITSISRLAKWCATRNFLRLSNLF